jgi:molecular chaperone DnaJ
MTKRDYYEVLGIDRAADGGTVKKAYRQRAYEFHPDRNPGDKSAEEKFKEAAEAYEVLSNPDMRAAYDRFGHEAVRRGAGGGPSPFSGFQNVEDVFSHFSDIFSDMFGFGGFGAGRRRGGRRAGPARGADLRYDAELEFLEAASGVKRELKLEELVACAACGGSRAEPGSAPQTCPRCDGRGQIVHSQGMFMLSTTCPQCRGEGQVIAKPCRTCGGEGHVRQQRKISVDIPAGVDDGVTMRLRGKGSAGERGGPAGDLHVVIHVKAHAEFVRKDYDVHSELAVSFVQAALGHKTSVSTVHGEADVEVPRGSQPGSTIVLRGKGVPHLPQDGGGAGSHVVHVRVEIPEELTPAQEKLMEQLAAEMSVDVHPVKKKAKRGGLRSFLERLRDEIG